MTTKSFHLETDASLNMRRPQEQPDGSNRQFAGGGIVVRGDSMEIVHHAAVPLGFVRSIDEAEALGAALEDERKRIATVERERGRLVVSSTTEES